MIVLCLLLLSALSLFSFILSVISNRCVTLLLILQSTFPQEIIFQPFLFLVVLQLEIVREKKKILVEVYASISMALSLSSCGSLRAPCGLIERKNREIRLGGFDPGCLGGDDYL